MTASAFAWRFLCVTVGLGPFAAATSTAAPASFPHVILNNDLSGWDTIFLNGKTPQGAPNQVDSRIAQAFRNYVALGDLPGIDAQSLAVNYSTFPLWGKSALYTMADHDRFLRSLQYYRGAGGSTGYPGRMRSSTRLYLDHGHDFVADFLNYRQDDQFPARPAQTKILDFRLNDHHWNWNWDLYNHQTRADIVNAPQDSKPFCDRPGHTEGDVENVEHWTQTSFTQYFQAFETGRLDPALSRRCIDRLCLDPVHIRNACSQGGCVLGQYHAEGHCAAVTLNLAQPDVQRFKLMQMAEIVTNYRPGYFEIDLDRFPQDFAMAEPLARRRDDMTDFLRTVTQTLRGIEPGIRIGLRMPSKRAHRAALGIDLPALDRFGMADYAILAMPAAADQQIEYEIDPAAARMKIYAEMFQTIDTLAPSAASFDDFAGLMRGGYATAEHLYPSDWRSLTTAAHLAYAHHHVFGMALFNTQYYDFDFLDGDRSKPLEQPAGAMGRLGEPASVAGGDQHYFLTSTHYGLPQACDARAVTQTDCDQLPFPAAELRRGHGFAMDMAPPAQGWRAHGVARLTILAYPAPGRPPAGRADYDDMRAGLSVAINGKELARLPGNAAWPLDPHDGARNNAYYKALWWTAPVFNLMLDVDTNNLIDGTNLVTIHYGPAPGLMPPNFRVVNFELALPSNRDAAKVRR